MTIPIIIISLLIIFVFVSIFVETLTEKRDRKVFPPPGKLVTVRGHKMHLLFTGMRHPGEPLVLLETGMGSWSFYWRFVQPCVSQLTRVCSYDRYGFGWSDPGTKPRSAHRIAVELHEALVTADEPGPYLLVGHSLGGVFMRQFARLYPEEVYGMLLIDSAHDDQFERMPWAKKEMQNIQLFFSFLAILHRLGILRLLGKSVLARFTSVNTTEDRKLFLATMLFSKYFETSRDEALWFANTIHPDEPLTSLGEKPLIIVQASGQPETLPRGYTQERWDKERYAWSEIQKELLKLSSNSRLVVAEKSVHTVQVEQPEVVIQAIEQLLRRQ